MTQSPTPGPPNPPVGRSATVIETDDDLRQALQSGLGARQTNASAPSPPNPSARPVAPSSRPASPFRPTARPPMAILTVHDDGKTEGETIRIRDGKFLIGRTEGDLLIPHDTRISSKHVEITRQQVGGFYRWVVTDLQSTNGMFVRISRTPLNDRAEFLVGNGRYRFDGPHTDPAATADYIAKGQPSGETQGWGDEPGPIRPAALTEFIGSEMGNRVLLSRPEYWIGTDPACAIGRADDPFCEPFHVRLYQGNRGSWHAEHNRTLNGLWLRVPQITVSSVLHFQVGEQQFRLKVPQ